MTDSKVKSILADKKLSGYEKAKQISEAIKKRQNKKSSDEEKKRD